ncbi:hypothetical protein [Xanthomonas graminis]|uniref:Uncharacterized protein n=1 Tax=Xanthomonas graminis pv. phlei TaxID=487906 RepID=A0A0K2ZXK1_9XANT|nr:hypothetical protein [Xanthomonas translucens]CTP90408.1 hypothetical protein XTPLMG730_2800 [Xanthomonas translucens pv. phlei]
MSLPVTVRAATWPDDGSVLAPPRTRILDRPDLLSRDTQGLGSCADGNLWLRSTARNNDTYYATSAVHLLETTTRAPHGAVR